MDLKRNAAVIKRLEDGIIRRQKGMREVACN